MSNESGTQRAAVLFPPPIGQTPVDVRLPHRLQPGWLEAARDHLEAGREWLAQQDAEVDWDDDDLDDRP